MLPRHASQRHASYASFAYGAHMSLFAFATPMVDADTAAFAAPPPYFRILRASYFRFASHFPPPLPALFSPLSFRLC